MSMATIYEAMATAALAAYAQAHDWRAAVVMSDDEAGVLADVFCGILAV